MKKVLCLLVMLIAFVSCSDRRVVLEVAEVNDYYRVSYYETEWMLWSKFRRVGSIILYTKEGLSNYYLMTVDENMSSWDFNQ
jgi:hypothetical protein